MQIPVVFAMPEESTSLLRQQICRGESGIQDVTTSVSRIDSARAEAWKKEDEDHVKDLIQKTVGFRHVDAHVTGVMVSCWLGQGNFFLDYVLIIST